MRIRAAVEMECDDTDDGRTAAREDLQLALDQLRG
jgi:hypothetical protein